MINHIISTILMITFGVSPLRAQLQPEINFKMYFDDAAGNSDTVTFGYDSLARLYIDPNFGEIDLSSIPMDSVFEVRGVASNGVSYQSKVSVNNLTWWYCTSTSHSPLYQALHAIGLLLFVGTPLILTLLV
jgi:hypothetical protein